MNLSIMQPYVFPYLGYFHLITASNKIVFLDDVTFKKGKSGWINKNRILVDSEPFTFRIPTSKTSSYKYISKTKIERKLYNKWNSKFMKTVKQNYSKAPHYIPVVTIIEDVLNKQVVSICDLAIESIKSIYQYINLDLNYTKSSVCSPESQGMEKSDRLITITKELGYNKYVNLIGGESMYSKDNFKTKGIQLHFVESQFKAYKQFGYKFQSKLSIIDLLMFNDISSIKNHFTTYNLV